LNVFQLHALLSCIAAAAHASEELRGRLARALTVARIARIELLWRGLDRLLSMQPTSERDFDVSNTPTKAIQVMALIWGDGSARSAIESQLADFFTRFKPELVRVWDMANSARIVQPGALKFWVAFASLARLVPSVIERFPDLSDMMEMALKRLVAGNMVSQKLAVRSEKARADVESLKKLAGMAVEPDTWAVFRG
jgi:hypothetical protein